MRTRMAFLVFAIAFSVLTGSCTVDQGNSTVRKQGEIRESNIVQEQGEIRESSTGREQGEILSRGRQIRVTEAYSDADATEAEAIRAVNDSGMSGAESAIHTHDNDQNARTMWLTKSNIQDKNWILFDFGRIEPIGEMYVWNFNQEGKTNAGLKDVKIFYSADGENWTNLHPEGKSYRFAKATGEMNMKATNLDGSGKPVEFHGICARYVKIVPDPEVKTGNWGYYENEEVRFGLSEVRFFRYKNKAVYDGYLAAEAIAADEGDAGKNNLVNGYGLSDAESREAVHSNLPETMWISRGETKEKKTILIDLDGTYAVKDMVVWNYNEKGKEDAGLRKVKIYYSVDKRSWTMLGETAFEFAKADGSDKLKATNLTDGNPVDFQNKVLRYVKIVPEEQDGNWGNPTYYGLSEIRFYAGEGLAAEPARDWTGLLSNFNGWIGADGIYSISLDGNDTYGSATETSKNMFIFSDTAIGTADPVTKSIPYYSMTNHSFAFLDGNKPDLSNFRFVTMHSKGGNMFRYKAWLGDLIAIGGKVHVAAYCPDEGWLPTRYDLITIPIVDSMPQLENFTKQEGVPAMYRDDKVLVTLFSGVMDNTEVSNPVTPDGYVYVYGIRETWEKRDKRLVVARVKKENYADFSQWTYWNGETWCKDIKELANPKSILGEAHVSCELSVSPITEGKYKGKYILCYTRDVMSQELEFCIGDSPIGPFDNPTHFYHCEDTELIDYREVYTYNSKAHPHLSAKGELLVSYNVNAINIATMNHNVNTVHPRFVRLYEIAKSEESER